MEDALALRKRMLRQQMRARRRALEDRGGKDEALCRAVSAWAPYREASCLLLYLSMAEEADTRRLLADALAARRQVFAPVCLPDGRLDFFSVASLDALRPGAFGIPEPDPARADPWEPGEDLSRCLCLVPGLAFDRRGCRLGYGKGYYDRFLAERAVPTLGLCYGELVLPRVPGGRHDRRVDFLATERGVFPCDGQEASPAGKDVTV